VLSVRTNEVLLTFPELLVPPEGLEAEAQATVRYSSPSGSFTAAGRIVRVASGPPVTITFMRLVPMRSDLGRPALRYPVIFPVSLHVENSRVAPGLGPEGAPATAQNISDSGVLLQTSILLAVGDTVRLALPGQEAEVHGRVIRVFENAGQFGVGIELVHATDVERQAWLTFAAERRRIG